MSTTSVSEKEVTNKERAEDKNGPSDAGSELEVAVKLHGYFKICA